MKQRLEERGKRKKEGKDIAGGEKCKQRDKSLPAQRDGRGMASLRPFPKVNTKRERSAEAPTEGDLEAHRASAARRGGL